MIAAAVLAAFALQTAEDAAGRYTVEIDGDGTCAVTLRPAAAQLPQSTLDGDSASGFAFAAPGCPGDLARTALWRLTLTDGALILADGAGETVLSAQRIDGVWTGRTHADQPAVLRPR